MKGNGQGLSQKLSAVGGDFSVSSKQSCEVVRFPPRKLPCMWT